MLKLALVVAVLAFAVAVNGQVMPGGVMTQDPSDPEYMKKAWKGATILNLESNLKYVMVPIKVVKADSQVVAGIKYTFEVLFGQSECDRGEVELSQLATANCQLIPKGSRALYKVELWEKPWQNFEQFTVTKIRDVAAGEKL
ncbi:cystatin domain protein [Ancylostoma caninum]|uniref:Cystatin domain protein n=1 Tax=Ancylostoma caninum TaxID=29170 RepID=A0A368HB95_ANCCA|nr:cystatin domain protein [Ancylostoma caninum]